MATQEEHASQINKTKKQELDPKMRTAHCRRLHAMMAFWEKEYPECYQAGARILTPEEVQNDMLFYHPEVRNYNGRDVVYKGLNITMVLAFLGANKCKDNGKMHSDTNMRKHHDAILFGVSAVGHLLPSTHYSGMEKFQNSFKKECRKEKEEGDAC